MIINRHWSEQLFNSSVLALSLSIRLQIEYATELQYGAHNGKQQFPEIRSKARVPIIDNLAQYTK